MCYIKILFLTTDWDSRKHASQRNKISAQKDWKKILEEKVTFCRTDGKAFTLS